MQPRSDAACHVVPQAKLIKENLFSTSSELLKPDSLYLPIKVLVGCCLDTPKQEIPIVKGNHVPG